MRRPLATVLAVLAVLAQIALGTARPLGVVLCLGESHASLELASDDCCSVHGENAHRSVAAIEHGCCSDVPLRAEASLADGQRPLPQTGVLAVLATASAAIVPDAVSRRAVLAAAPLAVPGFARRSPALRV